MSGTDDEGCDITFVCDSGIGDESPWRSQADIDLMVAAVNALPALLDALAERDGFAASTLRLQQRETDLTIALGNLLQVACHDSDCAHITERGACDCGFDAAYRAAERVWTAR